MEENAKNEYEIKKQERERAREKERTKARGDARVEKAKGSLLRYGVVILAVAAVGYGLFLFSRPRAPQGDDSSVTYAIQGREHIAEGATHPPYNSNPPSSGWHYPAPARGGFYDDSLPDEQVIHNLEHGDIWIAYRGDISDEAKDTLRSFAGRYTVVSPRPNNEGDISLVAWGRVDTFAIENGIVDESRIRNFITRYDNRGPERVRGAQTGHSGF